jgi:hypothetical protein
MVIILLASHCAAVTAGWLLHGRYAAKLRALLDEIF